MSPFSSLTSGGRASRSGEPFVWLTGMGLAVGLAMIGGLLAVIAWHGVLAFWPLRAARIELTPEAAQRMGVEALAGHIVLTRERAGAVPDARGRRPLELKLQVGNKELTGAGFVFLDKEDAAAITYPQEIVRLDRMEHGPALGELTALSLAGAPTIEAPDPRLMPELQRAIERATERRAALHRIEKRQIGAINAEMLQIERTRRRLERTGADGDALAQLEERRLALEERYEALAAEARALREAQGQDRLRYRIVDGREQEAAVGDIVRAYAPNQLGPWGRLALLLRNMALFIAEDPREANTEGGIFPALFGTFVMTIILSVAVTPFGVIAAIYLREYAKDGPVVRAVRIAINNLAGVPSIVFGVFGLGFFVYFVGGAIDRTFYADREGPVFGTGGILWASLTLALMTVPVVIVATEEALAAVSRGVREGSLACGASKWQTIQRVVLPASAPGIITGMILAMARGAGEVAPLMLVGVVKLAPTLPLDTTFPFLHLDRKFMHLGFHIYDLGFQSPDSDAARPMVFATTLLLIVLVVAMNLGAIVLRERLRRRYATGAF